jgi:NADPH:quinone reductase-like Zn-dependent oxidoreductase
MNTMKAAVVHAFGQPLQIEDVPVPAVTPERVLVKVVASGVCHTDLHAADGDWPVKPALPFIPGHEGVGTSRRWAPPSRESRKATESAFLGCTPPAAAASTASPAGRPCATSSR